MDSKPVISPQPSDICRQSSVICRLSSDFWRGRRVLITGHTGFKGSWLAFWLRRLGANVYGYSLSVPTEPSHFKLLDIDISSVWGDIRDPEKLGNALNDAKPEIVFHLAAQAIVRASYSNPLDTFSTNLNGTLNLLESCKRLSCVKAIIVVTTDKCYENFERAEPYRENDPLGGHDPYSASKACAEIACSCYRRSFFNAAQEMSGTLLATCRAGNVIGGGDWAQDRLLPDIMRAAAGGTTCIIRNPSSVRPWQHVLEPLHGYMLLAEQLFEGKSKFSSAWNFGPSTEDCLPVAKMAEKSKKIWSKIRLTPQKEQKAPHEAGLLLLDSSKARGELGWKPVWDSEAAIEKTVSWYRSYYEDGQILTEENICDYEKQI